MKTLYIKRRLLNGSQIVEWAKSVGFPKTIDAEDMHVTIMFSKKPVDWDLMPRDSDDILTNIASPRTVKPLGPDGAVVIAFRSSALKNRWDDLMAAGCSWDWPEYQPHVSFTYGGVPEGLNVTTVPPYMGEIKMGPEVWNEVDLNWKDKVTEK